MAHRCDLCKESKWEQKAKNKKQRKNKKSTPGIEKCTFMIYTPAATLKYQVFSPKCRNSRRANVVVERISCYYCMDGSGGVTAVSHVPNT